MRALLSTIVLIGCNPAPIAPTDPLPDCTVGWADRDGDGYGNPQLQTSDCQEPIAENDLDCNDLHDGINPDAIEVCDGQDNDCDGLTDVDDPDAAAEQWLDDDQDGYGVGEAIRSCDPIPGYAAQGGDCDDTRTAVNPEGVEACNGWDDDCNGLVDDEDPGIDPDSQNTYFEDLDDDGYGSGVVVLACSRPELTSNNSNDCDDVDPTSHPGATELCDLVDNDCDAMVDGFFGGTDLCTGLEHSYSGPYTATVTDGTTTRTCTGTADIVVDRTQSSTLLGTFSCTLDGPAGGFALDQSGTIEGWIDVDGGAGGEVDAFGGTLRTWDGSITSQRQIGDGDGLQLDGADSWDLTFGWNAPRVD